jgi:hypothetical protein
MSDFGRVDPGVSSSLAFFGQQRTKLSMLAFKTAHTFEHYGNLATYLRMNKIVPPSSETPPAAPPAKPARKRWRGQGIHCDGHKQSAFGDPRRVYPT